MLNYGCEEIRRYANYHLNGEFGSLQSALDEAVRMSTVEPEKTFIVYDSLQYIYALAFNGDLLDRFKLIAYSNI